MSDIDNEQAAHELAAAYTKLDHLSAALDTAQAELIRLLDCVGPTDAEIINSVLASLQSNKP